jgi:hypothetical protein
MEELSGRMCPNLGQTGYQPCPEKVLMTAPRRGPLVVIPILKAIGKSEGLLF